MLPRETKQLGVCVRIFCTSSYVVNATNNYDANMLQSEVRPVDPVITGRTASNRRRWECDTFCNELLTSNALYSSCCALVRAVMVTSIETAYHENF